jgi:hypothetical protein
MPGASIVLAFTIRRASPAPLSYRNRRRPARYDIFFYNGPFPRTARIERGSNA